MGSFIHERGNLESSIRRLNGLIWQHHHLVCQIDQLIAKLEMLIKLSYQNQHLEAQRQRLEELDNDER